MKKYWLYLTDLILLNIRSFNKSLLLMAFVIFHKEQPLLKTGSSEVHDRASQASI